MKNVKENKILAHNQVTLEEPKHLSMIAREYIFIKNF